MNKKIIYALTVAAMIVISDLAYIALTRTDVVVSVQTKEDVALASQQKEDKEVEVIRRYQKVRYSKIPTEIADIQAKLIVDTAKKHDLPTELLIGIIEKESHFDPTSESKADKDGVTAKGLMQIKGSTNVTVDHKRAFDISYNLDTGCNILKDKLTSNKGNMKKSLDAYSGGAKQYSERVYEGIGRYIMFRNKKDSEGEAVEVNR